MKKISIIIVNYNGEKDTLECLESLLEIEKSGFELSTVLVDNFSKNPIKINEEDYKVLGLKVIYNGENAGFSGGNNVGMDYAIKNGADYILLLNSDTYVKKDFLQSLFEFAEKENAGIVSPKIYFAKGSEFHKDRYKPEDLGKVIWYAGGEMDWANVIGKHRGVDEVDSGQYDLSGKTDFATGCCMLVKKEVFEKIGMLGEEYFLYYEDSDFSVKAIKKGYGIYYNPKSVIWHKNAGSTGGSGSDLQDYFITRNRLIFGMRFAPFRSRIALTKESLKILLNGRKMQKKGVIDFYTRRLGGGSYAKK